MQSYSNYIVNRLQIYPNPDAACIYFGECYVKKKINGEIIMIPCQSPCCPKHAHIPRKRWAKRLLREINLHPFNYFVTLPIGRILMRDEFSNLWSSFKHSLYYKQPPLRYCFATEVQNGKLHLHGVISSNEEVNTEMIKAKWFKFLKKHGHIDTLGLTSQIEKVKYPVRCAKYVAITEDCGKVTQLIPRGTYHRVFFASQRYGSIASTMAL